MSKHCSAHDHYVPDCNACRAAYAVFKRSLAPTVIKKPGTPFDLTLGEANLSAEPGPFFELPPLNNPLKPTDLSKLSVPELRKLCLDKGITNINGMPVSNCRRSTLTRTLGGESPEGEGESPSSEDGNKRDNKSKYGPPTTKPAPQPISPPMIPFADAILKSKEFEDAVRYADVMGDVKADIDALENRRLGMEKALVDLGEKIKEGVSGGVANIIVHTKGDLPVPNPSGEIPNSPILKRVIEHLSNREHVALVGPAGSGKSTIIRLACKALEAALYHTPCGGDIREQHLLGRTIPIQGEWTYIPAPFVQAFESETFSVAMLDEMDGVSDPSVLLPINDVLAGFDKLHLPWRWNAPYAERGKGFLGVAATMNTIGAGATSMYQGRTALDGSTLDRFVGRIIVVPYDAAYEEAYVRGPEGSPSCPSGSDFLFFIRNLRIKVEQNNLRRIVSTRMLQQGVAMLRRGWSLADTKEALLTGWSPDDRRLCGV